MKTNNKFILARLCCLTLLLLLGQASALLADPVWEPIPLTSKEQYEVRIPGGEGFQEIHAIVYAPSNPNRLYMSTDTSGIWRSDDDAKSWQPYMSNFEPFGARSLAVDSLNQDVLFAAGFLGEDKEESLKYPNRVQGIYRSRDGGGTWAKVLDKGDLFRQGTGGSLFVIMPSADDEINKRSSRIFAATCDKLYYSEKYGDAGTWKGPIIFPDVQEDKDKGVAASLPEIRTITKVPGQGPDSFEILIATSAGLYRYDPYKNSHPRKIGKGLSGAPRSIAVSDVDLTSGTKPRLVLAAMDTDGLYLSTDGGENFDLLKDSLWPKAPYPKTPFSDVAISPVDPKIMYARGHQHGWPPLHSLDGGTTWRWAKNTNKDGLIQHQGFFLSGPFAPHPRQALVALHPSNGRTAILRTDDGGVNWEYSGSGFSGGRMSDMIFREDGENYLCLTDMGLWRLDKERKIATKIPVEHPLELNSANACSADGDLFTIAIGAGREKVVASGTMTESKKIEWSFNEKIYNYKYSFTQKAPVFMQAIGDQLRLSQNGDWRTLPYEVVEVFGGAKPLIYAVEKNTKGYPLRLMASRDLGNSWQGINVFPTNMYSVDKIAITRPDDPKHPLRLFVATPNGFWRYDPQNVVKPWLKFTEQHGFMNNPWGRTDTIYVAIDPKNSDLVYAARHGRGFGRSRGIFRSTDGGESWHDFSGNYPTEAVHTIKINPYNSREVFIGGSIGTYRLKKQPTEKHAK